ncbi:MAG: hypothetical protein ACOCWG_06145, partial [bacterium]
LLALAINIKVTLDDPFVMLSDEAIAQTTTSSSSETYSGWLWKKKYHDVECGSITWEKTEYYDINDHLVGTTLIEGGIIKVEYNGTYSYSIYSSGTTGNITLQGWQCLDGWNPFCADNINPCDD